MRLPQRNRNKSKIKQTQAVIKNHIMKWAPIWEYQLTVNSRLVCLDSSHLCIVLASQGALFSWTLEIRISIFWYQSRFSPGIVFFLWASTNLTLIYPSDSHSDFLRSMPYIVISLINQFSIAFLPGCMARSLTISHESVKTRA